MKDWNVVVTVHDGGYNQAMRFLARLGEVAKTDFYNILVMRVDDPRQLMEAVQESVSGEGGEGQFLARLLPVTQTFTFQSAEEFEHKSCLAVDPWLPALAQRSFHVRMHRRGFKGKLSSMHEERFLDEYILDALNTAGTPGRISFSDPDAVIALETIGPRAGLSCWTREEMAHYPFLRLN